MHSAPMTLIWDLPTRLFHWLFALGFLAAAFIALALGEHSALFPYHALIGLTLAAMLLLRVIWGFVGSRHARFRDFVFPPAAVLGYFRDALARRDARSVGHNPASSYAIFAMLAIVAALAITGVMLGLGLEQAKEAHELLAYAMLAVVALHVLGVALHTLRHRENITASMIHGRKHADPALAIPSAHPLAAGLFLLLTSLWAGGLLRNFDAAAGTTTLPGTSISLQLSEAEGDRGGRTQNERGNDRDDD